MNYTVTVNMDNAAAGKALGQLLGMIDRTQNMQPAMEVLPEKVIFPSVMQSFAARGRPSWHFKGYQSEPPMVKIGLMKRGLTSRDAALNTIIVGPNSLYFALNEGPYIDASRMHVKGKKLKMGAVSKSPGVFYPGIHQHGGSRHYQNIILNLQEPEDTEKIKAILANFIVTGRPEVG